MLATRALGADVQDQALLEAAAFIANSRMVGDADPTILVALRKQKGLSESAIAQAFTFADQVTLRTVWVQNPPETINLVMATIENEGRLGRDAHDVLLGLRARGLTAAALKQDSPFRSEALIAEAFRQLQLRLVPPDEAKPPAPGAPAKRKSRTAMILGVVVTGLALTAGVVIYRRRRRLAQGSMFEPTQRAPRRRRAERTFA